MKYRYDFLILVFGFVLLLSGCARNYNSVNLAALPYTSVVENDSLDVSISVSPLGICKNFRYQYYFDKGDNTILAVKVKNNRTEPIVLNSKNLIISSNKGEHQITDLTSISNSMHQPGALYLLWSLLWLNIVKVEDNGFSGPKVTYIPIPIGLVIGLMNTATSYTADSKFRKQMHNDELIGKEVKPGTEVSGFIVVRGRTTGSISLKYNK